MSEITLHDIDVNAAGQLRVTTRNLAAWTGVDHDRLARAVEALEVTPEFRACQIEPDGEGYAIGAEVLGFLGHVIRKPQRPVVAEVLMAFNSRLRAIEQHRMHMWRLGRNQSGAPVVVH